MSSLFSTVSSESGFRLQYMEILNWGTFDQRIFRIAPKGNNSLLTGANASGKTTLIDALLTLIVPLKNDRFYNQSSGVEKKGDRTELSYVLGDYGDIQREEDSATTTQSLRDRSCYSILLANFENTDKKVVTIFQVRWFSSGEMKRSFGISYIPLEIEKHFSIFNGNGDWKKILELKLKNHSSRRKIDFFDGPTKYAERITKLFGMRSIKALSLFNQLVGIKVLGDLNEFIRDQMLEAKDVEKEYKALYDSFATLTSAKNDIEKAKKQIQLLEPIDKLVKELQIKQDELKKLEFDRDSSLYWFTQKAIELSGFEIERIKAVITKNTNQIDDLEYKEQLQRKKIDSVNIKIQNNEIGKQIQELNLEKGQFDRETKSKKDRLDQYNSIVSNLSFEKSPSETIFLNSLEKAQVEIQNITELRPDKEQEFYNLKKDIEQKTEQIEQGVETVKKLISSGNNITGRVSEIRNDILNAVGASKDEIPFIGELIAIKESEMKWELAIEKVLHNFGLTILVPDTYYDKVNDYVNRTNLKGRIIYQRVRQSFSINNLSSNDFGHNHLLNKIEFKSSSPYIDFVEENIISHYNFLCAENLSVFSKVNKAITLSGLIKYNKTRHEKDDRKLSFSKERFVLGWDNTSKINYWRDKVNILRKEKNKQQDQFNRINDEIIKLDSRKDKLNELIKSFSAFDLIDWGSSARNSEKISKRIRDLKNSNNQVKSLEHERQLLEKNLELIRENQKDLFENNGSNKKELEIAQKLFDDNKNIHRSLPKEDSKTIKISIDNEFIKDIKYSNFKEIRKSYQSENLKKISKVKSLLNNTKDNLKDKIRAFKIPGEAIKKKFPLWESDVNQLSLNVELASAYQDRLTSLKSDDLPKYEKEFNNYLEETLTNKVGEFNEFFESWSGEIRDTIFSLNQSLEKIDFETTPERTYIQLIAKPKKNDLIIDFKKSLLKAIPDFKQIHSTVDGKRIHFESAIQPFIEKLSDFDWRSKVLDVRNWFEYKAEEFFKQDHTKKKTYESMGQLSGGEKAQLTYTVLGSAIAYQFGLTKTGMESDSFRFIAIDEAFKAQDARKAKYLIDLCKQLHLQLLVVTPSDNIDIVEPHISFVHYTSRKENRNSWLYDMPIDQFQKQREKFLNQTG